MKLFTAHKKLLTTSQKGFTLIELLVVIGILGVLAAALVATIDPFEQLKKAQDANVKNTTVEFINANIRYYTTHNAMPWSDTANTTYQVNCAAAGQGNWNGTTINNGTAVTLSTMTGCLGALINDGEIKSSFTTVTNVLTSIMVTGTGNGVTACFLPQSKSQRNDPNAKYQANGAVATAGCPGGTACYWCSQ